MGADGEVGRSGGRERGLHRSIGGWIGGGWRFPVIRSACCMIFAYRISIRWSEPLSGSLSGVLSQETRVLLATPSIGVWAFAFLILRH